MDVFSKAKRSHIMSRIKNYGNSRTEERLACILRKANITGWRRRQTFPGKPDFLFRKSRVAVFVDGCFWHGCPLHYKTPQNNTDFWESKIRRNMDRDRRVNEILAKKGWKVIRVWQHELKVDLQDQVAERIARAVEGNKQQRFTD